ncbi:MAG: MFS transporter [Nocardioidaceae bacterium]
MISRRSPQGRWVLTAAVLGSGMAMLDGTVVNVALPRIGEGLAASMADLQWVVNGYLLSLASLILVGGSLGDHFGRRRMFMVGVAWFAAASACCAIAQTPLELVLARLVQGIGAALLTPGSLAMIQGSFRQEDRSQVIGQWAGLGGIAGAIGPLFGGWLIQVTSWRWIFALNVPIAVVVLVICARHVPESRDPESARGFDVAGAALTAAGLAGVTLALVQPSASYAVGSAVAGVVALVAFLLVERRSAHPLVELSLFRSRVFSVANAMTLLVYGALGAMLFFLVLQLQVSVGYTPLEAGLATVPITVLMLVGSGYSGALSQRIGPRPQMSAGPVVCGVGVLLLRGVGPHTDYLIGVLPGLLLFSVGLVALVTPLTASVLAAAPDRYAGAASGVNNAVARTGSLLAVAALPALVGLSGADYRHAAALTSAYRGAQLVCAVLLIAGGAVTFVGLSSRSPAPSPNNSSA